MPEASSDAPKQSAPRSMLRSVDVTAQPEGRIIKRGSLAFVGVVLQGVVRFLASFLVGRFTNPASLAVVSSGLSLANLLALAWPTSTGGAASRFVARARGEGERGDPAAVAKFLGVRTLQAMSTLAVCAMPLWVLLGGSWGEALIIAMLVIGYSGYSFTRGVHFGAGQATRQIKWDLLTSVLGIAGVAAILIYGLRPILVLLSLAIAYATYTLACWPWRVSGQLPRSQRRELDAYVAWASLGTLASAGLVQFSMLVAVAVAGNKEAGYFAAAMVLAAPAAMVANSMSMVLLPSMSEAFGKEDFRKFELQLNQSTRLLSVVLICVFGLLVVGARPLVELVWGEQYSRTATLIPLLLLPGMFRGLAAPSQGAISTMSPKGVTYSSLASVAGLCLAISLWLAMPGGWGVVGVAAGFAFGTSVISVSIYVKAWHDCRQRWGWISVRVGFATAVMIALHWCLAVSRFPLLYDSLIAVAFVAGWLVVVRGDAYRVLATVRRRSSGAS